MFFYCVEPEHQNIGTEYYDWKFTIRQGFGHHVIFPHVDSCLGVICQLPGNRIFAGHINGFYQNDYSANSHRNAFQNLIQQLNGAVATRAAIFGNIGDGAMEMGWLDHIAFPWANRVEFLSLTCAQGVDVMFDVDGGNLTVMRYQANRNYRQRPQQQAVANANLYTITGRTLINC